MLRRASRAGVAAVLLTSSSLARAASVGVTSSGQTIAMATAAAAAANASSVTGFGPPPYSLPPSVKMYKETAEWDAEHIPLGLKRAHATMEGVWAKIVVLEGHLTFVYEVPTETRVPLAAGQTGVTPPRVRHHVEPGQVCKFKLQFYREPVEGQESAAAETGVRAVDKEHE